MHEAVERGLRDGSLDTATAYRLQELMDRPASRPSGIPADLAERIPGIAPDCAARLRLLRMPGHGDGLDADCRELLAPFLAKRASSGELTLASTSLLEDSPAWNRSLGARADIDPFQGRVGFQPDRASPWGRRLGFRNGTLALALGDLEGWEEASALWNRPRRPKPSRSFLDGNGASLNGAALSVAQGSWELRAAGHSRLGSSAAVAGLGAFGQFLSLAGGQDSAGRWNGIALRSEAGFDGLSVRFQPALARRDDAWNTSSRLEFRGPEADVSWSSWMLWRRESFVHPLAETPAAVGPLRPLPLEDWASGGISVESRNAAGRIRTSLVAAARGNDAATLMPSLEARRSFDSSLVALEFRPWLLTSSGRPERFGGAVAQSVDHTWERWSLTLRADEKLDTAGHEITLTPTAAWRPVEGWEGRLAFRQSLVELDRSEVSLAGSLSPVRTATVTSELLRRQGSLRDAEARWYFRLEARARW